VTTDHWTVGGCKLRLRNNCLDDDDDDDDDV